MTEWTKSHLCESHACWEARVVEGGVEVRNSTEPDRTMFMTADMWRHLLTGITSGDFGDLVESA